jgi:transcriptional regulator with XRE-family HTH domain
VSKEASELSKRIRSAARISQQELADRLLVSRNYISLIESGKKAASVRLLSAMRQLAASVDKVSAPHPESPPVGPLLAEGPQASYGSSVTMRREIEQHNHDLLIAAKDDPRRLGWIREQQKAHLAVPPHWISHDEMNRRARAMADQLLERNRRAREQEAQGRRESA